MKNIRRSRFSTRLKTKSNQQKTSWIRHDVRASAVKDHPDLFNIDDEVDKVRSKVRELEQKIAGAPTREAERRIRERDLLPMDDEPLPSRHVEGGLRYSERNQRRNDRIKQALVTLLMVAGSLAFAGWAISYLLDQLQLFR
ncbi:hypothetical protein [Sulfuriroseicoccus oceanibius]|uniref:Uncharacterized protein n=1 Tax=Sulfuriroseicoccus oceanibius TaxID=2707525 RepID=A0A6B3L8L1_9BACT|nr:hypothetical protein [Sulfuriroseicoccus oceanibius]QQL43847.1 hypothetical protein G3M56_008040 [Sulfuriroseicoccus oceanibius]